MRKRSKYRPRPVLTNPLGYVLEGMQSLETHSSLLIDTKIRNHSAMVALTKGQATPADIRVLINMNNVTEALLRLGFGVEHREVMSQGNPALLEIIKRWSTTNRFVAKAHEMTALNTLLELHDAQLEVITVKDLERAVALIKKSRADGTMERVCVSAT